MAVIFDFFWWKSDYAYSGLLFSAIKADNNWKNKRIVPKWKDEHHLSHMGGNLQRVTVFSFFLACSILYGSFVHQCNWESHLQKPCFNLIHIFKAFTTRHIRYSFWHDKQKKSIKACCCFLNFTENLLNCQDEKYDNAISLYCKSSLKSLFKTHNFWSSALIDNVVYWRHHLLKKKTFWTWKSCFLFLKITKSTS